MDSFFTYIRRKRAEITKEYGDALAFCMALASDIDGADMPDCVRDVFLNAQPDDRDYAISSAYALLMGTERRKALSAYFTPPGLASAVLDAAAQFTDGVQDPAVLDPACGGGSFLTPVARHLIGLKCRQGKSAQVVCGSVLKQMKGVEAKPNRPHLRQGDNPLFKCLYQAYGGEGGIRSTIILCLDY